MVAATVDPSRQYLTPLPSPPPQATPGGAVSYCGFTWQVDAVQGDRCFIRWPGAQPYEWIRPWGDRFLLPAGWWVPVAQVHPCHPAPVPTPAPLPQGAGIVPGALVRKGTSLSPWVVLSVDGNVAKVRQISGYAVAMVLTANLDSLTLWE